MEIRYSKQAIKFLQKQDKPTRLRIDAVQPDDWDLKMLDDIKNNPDCNMFFDYESARKELGI